MDTEATLLAALHADPQDEVAWTALADWLEESGQPARAELTRLRLALRGTEVTWARAAREERQRALLLDGVRPCVPVLTGPLGLELALVPAGTFLMGSPATEALRESYEHQHEVEISKPFYLGVYPVTQAQYRELIGDNPSWFRAGSRGDGAKAVRGLDTRTFPVERVSWTQAVAFCKRLSGLPGEKAAGRVYRLPTEAEWECACRAGTTTAFNLGPAITAHQANYRGTEPYGDAARGPNLRRTVPVGRYPPNAFGLYDMHGQVWEWCSDVWDEQYYRRARRRDPKGPRSGTERCQRGGCWGAIGRCCRSAYRCSDSPDAEQYAFGFRVAMTMKRVS
jgi:uncharacterized protein (TIGR02996 family)